MQMTQLPLQGLDGPVLSADLLGQLLDGPLLVRRTDLEVFDARFHVLSTLKVCRRPPDGAGTVYFNRERSAGINRFVLSSH